MRMLDFERKSSVMKLQMYLTPKEAKRFRDQLDYLLRDPEANEHFHVFDDDGYREVSCSIITKKKLEDLANYTELEQQILREK